MKSGLLDLPAPLYAMLDSAMAAVLPATLRLLAWAALGGIVSVLLYRALSPQQRIAAAKAEAAALRRELDAYDGELGAAMPLVRAQLRASLRHVGLVLPATLIASLPVLSLLVWLDTAYGHAMPAPSHAPRVAVSPDYLDAQWQAQPPRVTVWHGQQAVAEVAVTAPVTRVEPRRWWNWLIGNPLGYLPAQGPAQELRIELPPRRYLDFGPAWLGSWLSVFLAALVVVSLAVHRLARVE